MTGRSEIRHSPGREWLPGEGAPNRAPSLLWKGPTRIFSDEMRNASDRVENAKARATAVPAVRLAERPSLVCATNACTLRPRAWRRATHGSPSYVLPRPPAIEVSMTSSLKDVRTGFLEFFRRHDHEVVASSPLVPRNDPTLMFTNAGMVQFKNVFTGQEKRALPRATTAQKCVRAGGKHNDLDRVGYTARHHTFFEMLGNFSFGDYFKERAIELAWKLVTEDYGLPQGRLLATVYAEDDEAFKLWGKIAGLPESRDHPHRRPPTISGRWATPARAAPAPRFSTTTASISPAARPARPMKTATASSRSGISSSCSTSSSPGGVRENLPKPSVDTGMGLERITAVLQGVHDNYDIDLFRHLIAASAEKSGASVDRAARGQPSRHRRSSARVVLPDRRRRAALERRPRLCAPPHHAPRHASRAHPGLQGPADVPARADARRRDGRGLSRAQARRSARHRNLEARGNPFPRDAGARAEAARRSDRETETGRHASRRSRLQALRHLRLPARSDRRRAARTRHRRRWQRLRCRDGGAEGRSAQGVGGIGRSGHRRALVLAARGARRRPNSWATTPRTPKARSQPSSRTICAPSEAARARPCASSPTRRRSMARAAARSAMSARSSRARAPKAKSSTPRRSSAICTSTWSRSRAASSPSAMRSSCASIPRSAAPRAPITRRRICCTRRSSTCSARTCRRRARSSGPNACASTSRTRRRSRTTS